MDTKILAATVQILFTLCLFITLDSAYASSSNCSNVTTLRDGWWGGDGGETRVGGLSCLQNKDDEKMLKEFDKLIRVKYGIRKVKRKHPMADAVALLNLTNEWPGVKCSDSSKGGLECQYKNHRGDEVTKNFPTLTAEFANSQLDKIVETPIEKEWRINNKVKTPEERIKELELQVAKLKALTDGGMCGCGRGSTASVPSAAAETFSSKTSSKPSKESAPKPTTSLNNYVGKYYGPTSKPSSSSSGVKEGQYHKMRRTPATK